MGSPPPVNAPSVGQQASASADAGFQPSPTGATLCGFGIPGFFLSFSFSIPGFPPFAFPPTFNFMIGLNCDLSNPISASVGFGGGRVAQSDPDPFDETP